MYIAYFQRKVIRPNKALRLTPLRPRKPSIRPRFLSTYITPEFGRLIRVAELGVRH